MLKRKHTLKTRKTALTCTESGCCRTTVKAGASQKAQKLKEVKFSQKISSWFNGYFEELTSKLKPKDDTINSSLSQLVSRFYHTLFRFVKATLCSTKSLLRFRKNGSIATTRPTRYKT